MFQVKNAAMTITPKMVKESGEPRYVKNFIAAVSGGAAKT